MSESASRGERIPVGISRCLLGEEVRYNGGHKLSRYCRDHLGDWFDFVDFCPEVQVGLGVPRPPMRLVERGDGERAIRVVEIEDRSRDHTDALAGLADSEWPALDELCGFVFMQNPPSCGLFRVKVYHPNGNPLHPQGQGAFAARVQQHKPWLPMEEAGRLTDANLRENFVTRVFIYHEWRSLLRERGESIARGDVIDFHARQKYLLLAHSQRYYRLIGKMLARAGAYSIPLLVQRYEKLLMSGLRELAGRKGHSNALQHMQGYVSRQLSAEQRADLTAVVESYRQGEVPLIAPLVLLRHYAGLGGDYFRRQVYLEPHPKRLGLYNDI